MSTTQKATGGTSTRRPLVPAQLVKPPTPVEVEPPSAPLQSAGSLMLTTRVVSKREVANGGAKSNGAGLRCDLCGDGGTLLIECCKCGRTNCALCIPDLVAIDPEFLGSLEYRCPPCHGRRRRFYGLRDGEVPLFPNGMRITEHAIGGHGARFNSSSIAIVELILSSLPQAGTPAQVLFTYLQACFTSNPDDLKWFRCTLDVDPDNLKTHQHKIKNIICSLNGGDFRRIVFIIQTYADNDRGNLLYKGDGNTSYPLSTSVSDFFEAVVGEELQEYISEREYSLMVLAACGSVVNNPEALQQLQEVTKAFNFTDAFAFSDPNLDPHRVISFVNEFAMNVLITGHKSSIALPTILSSSSTSQFTGIVHLSKTEAGIQTQRFERLHPTTRPNGKRLPPQCHECRCYRPWVVPSEQLKKYNRKLVFKCGTKGCSGVFKARRLKGYRPLDEDHAKMFSKLL